MAVLTNITGGFANRPRPEQAARSTVDAPARLAASLSALLLRLTARQFDRALGDGLRHVAAGLDADICLLTQFDDDPASVNSWPYWARPVAPVVDG